MLSNPNGLHPRQRQHRRQQSTPTAFEGVKIPHLPNTTHRQAAGHRRGLSLDIRRQHNSTSPTARQNFMVSTTTNNTGLANTSQHNVLREAQQQRIQARPGTQHPYVTLAPSGSENYLISPHGTPQAQRFDPSCFDPNNISFDAYSGDLNMMMGKGQAAYGENMSGGRDFDIFNNDSALSTPTFMSFQESPSAQGWASEGDTSSTRRTSRRISNGIMDRVNKFETLGADGLPTRPITPPSGNVQNYYPPTPMETPQDRLAKAEPTPSRFQDGYDESMEETIKPVRNRSGNQRAQTIFQDMRKQSEQQQPQQQPIVPSPPKSNQLPEADSFNNMPLQTPDYMNMNSFNNEFMKIENNFDMTQQMSQHTSPDTPQMAQFVGGFNKPDLSPYPLDAQSLSAIPSNCPSRQDSPHRRTESLASIASAASIADINIEETKTETGVTLEEISQYIQGPDAADGKWMCLYEECGKKFGRKENIKSHVQTHLNDRQYQCPTCKKCFVRQHDLKRHAKIHTGIKPYPCECGNSFARHDALTRHRQRGMCIGAFDGIVRKVVKRGRPKKNRPDMETRLEKSARTRKKNLSVSSVSSFSGYSDSSAGNSPDADFNMLDDMVDIGMSQQTQNLASVSSAPMTSIPAPAISDMASSPSAASAHSYVSPEALMDGTPVNPTSPAKSAAGSQYNTPPELSQSSSPPPHQYFEVEPNTSINTDDLSTLSGTSAIMGSSSMNGTLPLGMSDHDDDMLLQFANDDGLVQLDRESSMLMMSKFDEEFDNAVMFGTNTDDVFFGSN